MKICNHYLIFLLLLSASNVFASSSINNQILIIEPITNKNMPPPMPGTKNVPLLIEKDLSEIKNIQSVIDIQPFIFKSITLIDKQERSHHVLVLTAEPEIKNLLELYEVQLNPAFNELNDMNKLFLSEDLSNVIGFEADSDNWVVKSKVEVFDPLQSAVSYMDEDIIINGVLSSELEADKISNKNLFGYEFSYKILKNNIDLKNQTNKMDYYLPPYFVVKISGSGVNQDAIDKIIQKLERVFTSDDFNTKFRIKSNN